MSKESLRGVGVARELAVRGWLDDIERALRDVFTTETEEDEAFDNATSSLDSLRSYLEKSFPEWGVQEAPDA